MTYYIYVLEETSLRVLIQMATTTTILVVAQKAMPFSVESDSHEFASSTYRSNDVCGPTTEAIQPGGPFTRLHLLISSSDKETSSVTSSRECTSQYMMFGKSKRTFCFLWVAGCRSHCGRKVLSVDMNGQDTICCGSRRVLVPDRTGNSMSSRLSIV